VVPRFYHSQRSTKSSKMSNRAAFLEAEKGQIIVRDADYSQPGEGEVLIKVHACGIQPADVKVAKYALLAMEYPTVIGSPAAGIVEAVGPGVTKVSVGERVVCGTKVFVQKKAKYGGLQRFTLVDASEVVEVKWQSNYLLASS
jgi:NADPH:quinone reductase-like Zn-dependent oxidoreductase